MKKTVSFSTLVLLIVGSLTACSSKTVTETPTVDSTATYIADELAKAEADSLLLKSKKQEVTIFLDSVYNSLEVFGEGQLNSRAAIRRHYESKELAYAHKHWRLVEDGEVIQEDAPDIFYECYCTSCSYHSYKWSVSDIELSEDGQMAVVICNYSFVTEEDVKDHHRHKHEFHLILENGLWVVDDLLVDGESIKRAYQTNSYRFFMS